MKAIIFIHADGARYLAFVVPAAFDTQAWAQSRRQSLQFLTVVRILEQDAESDSPPLKRDCPT